MTWLINLYNTNTLFHSFVLAIEGAVISFLTSYSGGLPTTKAAWVSVAFALGAGVWGAFKRWLATNVATQNLPMKS